MRGHFGKKFSQPCGPLLFYGGGGGGGGGGVGGGGGGVVVWESMIPRSLP